MDKKESWSLGYCPKCEKEAVMVREIKTMVGTKLILCEKCLEELWALYLGSEGV